jgi:hypothetical protein
MALSVASLSKYTVDLTISISSSPTTSLLQYSDPITSQLNCTSDGVVNGFSDEVILQGGLIDMSSAQGVTGPEDFDDLASSFSCSPV